MGVYIPCGPFREGGHISEVRFQCNISANSTIAWMPFVCLSGDLTLANCQAGTPVVGYSNYRFLDLPLIRFRCYIYSTYPVVLPCWIRVVGGAQWVIVCVRLFSTYTLHALASVTVEGVDRTE